MKHLIAQGLFLLLFTASAIAQKSSVSVLFGPSAFRYVPNQFMKTEINPPMGYCFGVDFGRSIHAGWNVKLGLRYNAWKVPDLNGPLQWPSENNNGSYQFDPALQHYLIQGYSTRKALQVLSGLGWESRGDGFRWFAHGEFGITRFLKNNVGLSTKISPTAGLSFGAAWRVAPNLRVVIAPDARWVFRGSGQQNPDEFNTFSMQVEIGARYNF